MKSLSIHELCFRYLRGERPALDRIDLEVEPGESVAVVGLSGAGKSTLLRCLNRLAPESYRGELSGRVELFGEDIAGRRPTELAGVVGLVFQDFESQLFSTAAEQDVAFGPENLGLSTEEIRARVDEALAAVGMSALRRRDPSTLSGGQKQRLAIASVLSLRPRLLALDEPVTDLDPAGRGEVAALMKKLCDSGISVMVAEHECELIAPTDRVIGLREGVKVCDRATSDLLWDAEALTGLGVRPPDLARVLPGLGRHERPASVKDAARLLAELGIRLDPATLPPDDDKTGEALIAITGLHHSYPNGVEAVAGVDLGIRAGDFIAVLGKNGSGKTTLVKHLNGLLKASQGAVEIEGRDSRDLAASELGRRVGFVFQDPDHQLFAGRVWEEVAFAPRNFGFGEDQVKSRVDQSLHLVGLTGSEDRDPFTLTKGERQRVALASVLAAEPPVIVMDEPTTGLDYPAQRAVMDLLAALNREGRTVIVVTHSIWVAAEYARRCLVMAGGRVAAFGPTRLVLSDPGLLERAGLAMPAVTALSRELGAAALTVEEFLQAAQIKGGR